MKETTKPASPSAANLLYPLSEFCLAAGLSIPTHECLAGEAVPEPYQRLLVHERDMTPVLEQRHGQTMTLKILHKQVTDTFLMRQVLLVGDDDQTIAEFGAIRINLERFTDDSAQQIRECRRPLGAILRDAQIEHTSSPGGYFRVRADGLMPQALNTHLGHWLYGRQNRLVDPQQRDLAQVVEILPGLEDTR